VLTCCVGMVRCVWFWVMSGYVGNESRSCVTSSGQQSRICRGLVWEVGSIVGEES